MALAVPRDKSTTGGASKQLRQREGFAPQNAKDGTDRTRRKNAKGPQGKPWRPGTQTPRSTGMRCSDCARLQTRQLAYLIVDQDAQRGLIGIANPVLDVLVQFLELHDGIRVLRLFNVLERLLIQLHK